MMVELSILDRVWMTIQGLFAGGQMSRVGLLVLILGVAVVGVGYWVTRDKT